MSESEDTSVPEPVKIERIYTGSCPSLTNRSTLTYAIGRNAEDQSLHLAIVGNSGAGMFCSDFAPATQIEAIVVGSLELTSTALKVLHPGKSTNTAGFILAVLGDLGLVRRATENTRLHEHVPGTTFESVALAKIEAEQSSPKSKRKSKEG